MVEEIENIRKKALLAQKEIHALRKELKEAIEINDKMASSLFDTVLETLDKIEDQEKEKIKVEPRNWEKIKEKYADIKTPIIELLRKMGIEKLAVPINKIPEYCKTVGSIVDPTRVNGTVVEVVKDGYRKDKKILRLTHVIIVQNLSTL